MEVNRMWKANLLTSRYRLRVAICHFVGCQVETADHAVIPEGL
jgi:hypothetical protein